jgi:hypothetical protein
MAIRWTANDSRAYRDVTDAGEKIRAAYEAGKAGRAYREGAELKGEDKEAIQGYLDQAAALPSAQNGELDNSDYSPGGLGAKSNQQNAALRQQSAAIASPEARHMAGLGGQQKYYSERGDVERAGRIGERIEGIKTNQLRMKLGEEELARAPMQREFLQGQIDMQPGARRAQGLAIRSAEFDNEIKEFDTKFKKASREGLPALVKLYGEGISDGFQPKLVKDEKTGALSVYQVNESDGKETLWKTFAGDKRMGITPEMEATAEVKALMGDPKTQLEIIKLNASAAQAKERNAVLDRLYSQRYNKSAKGQVVEVTYKGADGKVQTGRIGIEHAGRKLKAYDIITGEDLPADDPRAKALASGVPRNAKDDPASNPEVLNINAKIKKGNATPEDLGRLSQIGKLAAVRETFDAAAEGDRTGAVIDLFTKGVMGKGGMAETMEAQNQLAAQLGISREELAIGRAAARAKNAPPPRVGLGGGGPTPGSPAAKALEARQQRAQQDRERQEAESMAAAAQRAREVEEYQKRNAWMNQGLVR